MHTASDAAPGHSQHFDEAAAEEEVERRLAQYAFVREERDREVRLLFRDVPAPEVVLSFRAAGAGLISVSGERVRTAPPPGDPEATSQALEVQPEDATPDQPDARHGKKRRKQPLPPPPSGELVMRYFFSLGETVYTVNLASPTGVVGSVASIYPGAKLAEEELGRRLNVIFT